MAEINSIEEMSMDNYWNSDDYYPFGKVYKHVNRLSEYKNTKDYAILQEMLAIYEKCSKLKYIACREKPSCEFYTEIIEIMEKHISDLDAKYDLLFAVPGKIPPRLILKYAIDMAEGAERDFRRYML